MSAVVLAVWVGCAIGLLPPPEAPLHEGVTPEVPIHREAIAVSQRKSLRGLATYYAYHEGQAAAGPRLKRMLGSHWRGMKVTVWKGDAHVVVRLTDSCACGDRPGGHTIIDLDERDFAKLASLSEGVITVRVTK